MTGRSPDMARPTAKPTMPASASGVSKHRLSPYAENSPSVMRKTPPRRPTSSPNTTTRSSSAMASRRAAFNALAMVVLVIGGQLREHHVALLAQGLRQRRVDLGEQRHRVEVGLGGH